MVNPVTPIGRSLTLYDELNKAIQTPGDKEPEQVKQPQRQTLREAMDLINFKIKTRQSKFDASPANGEHQYHDITVSKAKPRTGYLGRKP